MVCSLILNAKCSDLLVRSARWTRSYNRIRPRPTDILITEEEPTQASLTWSSVIANMKSFYRTCNPEDQMDFLIKVNDLVCQLQNEARKKTHPSAPSTSYSKPRRFKTVTRDVSDSCFICGTDDEISWIICTTCTTYVHKDCLPSAKEQRCPCCHRSIQMLPEW